MAGKTTGKAVKPSATKPKAKTPAPRVPAVLLWIFGVLVVLLLAFGLLLRSLINSQGVETAAVRPTATPTAGIAAEAELPQPMAEVSLYQLRVETQQLVNATRGIWGPITGVRVYVTSFQDGDTRPSFLPLGRPTRLESETRLETTTDGVPVAQITFTLPEGLYWVGLELPTDCAVWTPTFSWDADNQLVLSPWKIVYVTRHGEFNTTIEKFQIVCGLAVSLTATPVPPQVTPTEPPRETPTTPPPTPTDSCGPDCVEPSTPVPTPTEYPPEVPTPTPVR